MNWIIEFFDENVEAETLALPAKILAKLLHIFYLVEIALKRKKETDNTNS